MSSESEERLRALLTGVDGCDQKYQAQAWLQSSDKVRPPTKTANRRGGKRRAQHVTLAHVSLLEKPGA